jgi:hypothetical protein
MLGGRLRGLDKPAIIDLAHYDGLPAASAVFFAHLYGMAGSRRKP